MNEATFKRNVRLVKAVLWGVILCMIATFALAARAVDPPPPSPPDYIRLGTAPFDTPIVTPNKIERMNAKIEAAVFAEIDPVWREANAATNAVNFTNAISLAFGDMAQAGDHATAYGKAAIAAAFKGAAFGYGAYAALPHCAALGGGASALGQESTALGSSAFAGDWGCTAAGTRALARLDKAVAVGYCAAASNRVGVAVGAHAVVSANDGTALGFKAHATAKKAVQIGEGVNRNPGTLQFRAFQLLDDEGIIPAERLGTWEKGPNATIWFIVEVNGRLYRINLEPVPGQ